MEDPLLSHGFCSWQGLETGLKLAARFILLLLFESSLTASTDPSAITCGIERMLRPFPLRWLGISSFSLPTTTGSIGFLLRREKSVAKAAQAARGMDFVKNPFHSVPALAIPLLRGVIRDAEELALAMESRGYEETDGPRYTSFPCRNAIGKHLLSWHFFYHLYSVYMKTAQQVTPNLRRRK